MSNVAEAVDFRVGMAEWLGTLTNFYNKDIRALPENLLSTSPGGVAKTPGAMTGEVVGMIKWTATSLRGETPPEVSEADMLAAGSALTTHDAICTAMDNAANDLGEAIRNADPAMFQKVVMAPFGMEMPLMAICQISINHIWYHDGQLNLIQALNGDDKIHWMG